MVDSNCVETVNDLLHCSIARDIWSFVFSPLGVMWVMPYIMLNLLAGWKDWVTLYYGIFAGLFLLVIWDIPIGSPWFEPGFPPWANGTEPRGSWADSLVFGKGWLLKHKNAMIRNAVPLALMWCFWSKWKFLYIFMNEKLQLKASSSCFLDHYTNA